MTCFKLAVGSTAFCIAATLTPPARGQVTIVNLGTLYSGSLHTGARGLNNTGIVVGYSQNASALAFPFRWQDGVMSNLGAGIQGTAEAVNDGGYIVGYTTIGNVRAFVYTNGVLTGLGTLPGGSDSQAFGINNAGLIVGHARDSNGSFRACIFQNSLVTSLGTLGGSQSGATDVNAAGDIVGTARNASDQNRAFVYRNGTMSALPTLGGTEGIGEAINDRGVVVGASLVSRNIQRGFIYDGGELTTIGTFGGDQSQALDINNVDQVVGFARDLSGNPCAFLFQDGSLIDLNDLLPSGSGWSHLSIAYAINDLGHIVGEGIYQGRTRGFLMVVPTPPTMALMSVTSWIGLPRRRRAPKSPTP